MKNYLDNMARNLNGPNKKQYEKGVLDFDKKILEMAGFKEMPNGTIVSPDEYLKRTGRSATGGQRQPRRAEQEAERQARREAERQAQRDRENPPNDADGAQGYE
jgi:hypothetical protein